MFSNRPICKRRIFTKKRLIFRHFAWKREVMIPKRHQTSKIFGLVCFQAAYEICSQSEHALGLNYVVLSNLQNPKFHRNPLKISLSKNTSFTHWLITRHLAMIQLWSIPPSIAYHLPRKMRYRWTKSNEKWRQETRSKTWHQIRNTLYIYVYIIYSWV